MSEFRDIDQYQIIIDKLINGEINSGLAPMKRNWIPKYVYHFTDLDNAVNIIENKMIYSRDRVKELDLMASENASTQVISNTKKNWTSYVRFYFRPKTPTQYHNEGIRCTSTLSGLNAHCPIPVFFLFDSANMLALKESRFSYGSLAASSSTSTYNTPEEFSNMPFSSVFHEGQIQDRTIIHNRHAELIVPLHSSLEHCKKIVVRSQAEKELLLYKLENVLLGNLREQIVIDSRNNLFYSKWTYIEKVTLTKERITLEVNIGEGEPSFRSHLEILEYQTGLKYISTNEDYKPNSRLTTYNLVNLKYPDSYEVKFFLDGHLAYRGTFIDDDLLPF